MARSDKKRVVLAYSGGLDTSVVTRWLVERGWEVVCLTVDVGFLDADPGLEERALAAGAERLVVADAQGQQRVDGAPILAAPTGAVPGICLTDAAYIEIDHALAAVLDPGREGAGNLEQHFLRGVLALRVAGARDEAGLDVSGLGHGQPRPHPGAPRQPGGGDDSRRWALVNHDRLAGKLRRPPQVGG